MASPVLSEAMAASLLSPPRGRGAAGHKAAVDRGRDIAARPPAEAVAGLPAVHAKGDSVELAALVRGSDAGSSYDVRVKFDVSDGKSLQASCSCPAAAKGPSLCKHGAALVLMYAKDPGGFKRTDRGLSPGPSPRRRELTPAPSIEEVEHRERDGDRREIALGEPLPTRCDCGQPLGKPTKVTKNTENKGRYFLGCPKFRTRDRAEKCGYFVWVSEEAAMAALSPPKPTNSGTTLTPPMSQPPEDAALPTPAPTGADPSFAAKRSRRKKVAEFADDVPEADEAPKAADGAKAAGSPKAPPEQLKDERRTVKADDSDSETGDEAPAKTRKRTRRASPAAPSKRARTSRAGPEDEPMEDNAKEPEPKRPDPQPEPAATQPIAEEEPARKPRARRGTRAVSPAPLVEPSNTQPAAGKPAPRRSRAKKAQEPSQADLGEEEPAAEDGPQPMDTQPIAEAPARRTRAKPGAAGEAKPARTPRKPRAKPAASPDPEPAADAVHVEAPASPSLTPDAPAVLAPESQPAILAPESQPAAAPAPEPVRPAKPSQQPSPARKAFDDFLDNLLPSQPLPSLMDDLPPPEPEPNSAAVPHARPTSAKFDDLLRELEEQVPETQFAPPPADEMEWSPVPAPAPPKVADTIGEAPAPIGAAPAPARILDPIDEASTVSVDSDETQPLDTRRRRPAGPAPEVTVTIVPVPNEPEEIEEAEEEAPRQVKGKRKAEEQPSAAKKKPSPAKSPAKSSAPTPRSRSPSPVGGRKLPGWMTGEAVKKSPRAAKPKADKEEGKAKPAARTPRTKKAAKDDEEGDLMDFDPFAAGVDGTQEDSQAFFRDPLLSKPAGAAAKKDAGEFKAPERPDPIEETPPTQEMHPALKKADTLSQLIDMYAGTQQGTQH